MKRLSSLYLTLGALLGISFWLVAGIVLAQAPPFAKSMQSLDHTLLARWLLEQSHQHPLVAVWLVGLCLGVGLMVVNLLACVWTRVLPRLKGGGSLKSWLLAVVHILMILVLCGHLSEMSLGFKEEGIRLLAGQSAPLSKGLVLKVDQVRFGDDPALLNLTYRQGRLAHTTDAFHREDNQIRLTLLKDGRPEAESVVRILEPLVLGNLRITLTDFYRDGEGESPRVGGVFTVTNNPFTMVFFAAYLAWIASYLLLAFTTTRQAAHRAEAHERVVPV